MTFEIVRCIPQGGWLVPEQTQTEVTLITKQATEVSSDVIVIDHKDTFSVWSSVPPWIGCTTNRAAMVLLCENLFIARYRKTVSFEFALPIVFRLLYCIATCFRSAIVFFSFSSIFRILCHSFLVTCSLLFKTPRVRFWICLDSCVPISAILSSYFGVAVRHVCNLVYMRPPQMGAV